MTDRIEAPRKPGESLVEWVVRWMEWRDARKVVREQLAQVMAERKVQP